MMKRIVAAVIGIAIIVCIGAFIYTRSPSQAELDRLKQKLHYKRNVLGCDNATQLLNYVERQREIELANQREEKARLQLQPEEQQATVYKYDTPLAREWKEQVINNPEVYKQQFQQNRIERLAAEVNNSDTWLDEFLDIAKKNYRTECGK